MQVYIEKFIKSAQKSVAYNEVAKQRFHFQSARILCQLAEKLGIQEDDYDLRHNMGGIAVSGEITLHSDRLYVQFSQSSLGVEYGFLWRTCKSRKDYVGGGNNWMKWERLGDLYKVATVMLTAANEEAKATTVESEEVKRRCAAN